MKRLSYLAALALMICTICACNGDNASPESDTGEANNFSSEMMIEHSGNFSSEMVIESSTDVTIVEMP